MSARHQVRASDGEGLARNETKAPGASPAPARDNPLQLLRDAIAQLKSPTGGLPDQEQVANLLAEAREALEHANVVGRAVAQCEGHLREAQFEQALEALDGALRTYPDDPLLAGRRRGVEEQLKAFQSAAAVRGAIEEAKWLLDHDRTDLAAQFLKEKAAELPDEEELTARLAELEALLPDWTERREVQDALGRVQTLEQLEQWQAALTVIEEALQAYPSNQDLQAPAERLRGCLIDHERRKKLARRVELIAQQIAAHAWRQALTLLENTQLEFPDSPGLEPLRREITAGLKNSERDEVVSEVQKYLADAELDQAERVLRRGLKALGPEPVLETLRKEVEAERRYRDELRNAQVLFGRRQLEEAEQVLTQLLDSHRPEAKALLEAVRTARAATEEENFLDRGREKALGLIQQQQFAQAADLLRNLLALFPGNAILQRDLAAAQNALAQAGPAIAPDHVAPQEEPPEPADPAVVPVAVGIDSGPPPARLRRAAVAGAASLLLASAAGAAWKLSHSAAPVPHPSAASAIPATASTPAPPPTAVQPATPLPAPAPESQVVGGGHTAPKPGPAATPADRTEAKANPSTTGPLRAFVPPNAAPSPRQNQTGALPAPPGVDPAISVTAIPFLPVASGITVKAPEPPQPAAGPAPAPPPKPVLPLGGKLEQAQLVSRILPAYPAIARQRGQTGTVQLTAVIDEKGSVKDVKVTAGDPVLAAAARSAVQGWKYKPAILNGKPIETSTQIEIFFGEPKK
jgi:protein TonB